MKQTELTLIEYALDDVRQHVRLLGSRGKDDALREIARALVPIAEKIRTANVRRFLATFGGAE